MTSQDPYGGTYVSFVQTCCGKRGYHTRADARKVVKEMRRNHQIRDSADRLSTYRCPTGRWHVGNEYGKGPNVNDPRLRFLEET